MNFNLFRIAEIDSPGDFAYKRKSNFHSGLDMYCEPNAPVHALEDGRVLNLEHFTGEFAIPQTLKYNNTKSLIIESQSGNIAYCELEPAKGIRIGSKVKAGDLIGHIIPVLKEIKIPEIGRSMLHLELYTSGICTLDWFHDQSKPVELINPRELINKHFKSFSHHNSLKEC